MWLVSIKTAGGVKEIGDIAGYFPDSHNFTQYELDTFNFLKIEGLTIQEIRDYQKSIMDVRKVYKSETTSWTAIQPQLKMAWQNKTDMKWYFLETDPKFWFTIKNMTEGEKTILSSISATKQEKVVALVNLESKVADYIENQVEVI
jgi:hypothetical protein